MLFHSNASDSSNELGFKILLIDSKKGSILGIDIARNGEMFAAVFAELEKLFPLDALTQEKIYDVINALGAQDICKTNVIHQFKFNW